MCDTILIVDDDPSLLSSLSLYLLNQGFDIESCGNVNSALQFLDGNIPDLIISDIVMPKQNGYNLLHYLKSNSRYKQIPLIFLSAKGMTQDRILGYNLGCHGYLVKPFDPEELLAMIVNVLSRINNDINDEITSDDDDMESSSDLSNTRNIPEKLVLFTFREETVLKCVLKGMTNKEIAIKLSISLRNVEKYVSRLLAKTATRNRTELTQYCYKHKICFKKGE